MLVHLLAIAVGSSLSKIISLQMMVQSASAGMGKDIMCIVYPRNKVIIFYALSAVRYLIGRSLMYRLLR